MTADKVEAPFTRDQADSLNHYQFSGVFHPFTCAEDHPHTLLVALSGRPLGLSLRGLRLHPGLGVGVDG